VLALPFLFALVFGVVALGGMLSAKNRTVGAARDGARAAALAQPFPTEPAGIALSLTSAACPARTDPAFTTANVSVKAVYANYKIALPISITKTFTETVTFRCGG
jgi:Flp pilus assembly protein TadG